MIGYKAFDKDLRCRGFQFEVGKTYSTGRKKEELKVCSDTVFHFCRELHRIESESDYRLSESRVCEVIATGDIVGEGSKFGTNEIMILRELTQEEKDKFCNCNTGNCNTGNWNTGDRNTGNWNTGNWNTGNWNTGNWNTGDRNTGNWNTGNCNTGNCNTGDWNTGNCNTGDRNTGDRNTGNWNTGDRNTGFFNTKDGKIMLFNKPTDKTRAELDFPHFLYFDLTVWVSHDTATDEEKEEHKKEIECAGGFLKELDYKEAFRRAYAKSGAEEHGMLFALPNFDPAVFEEISGVDTADEYAMWKRETEVAQE